MRSARGRDHLTRRPEARLRALACVALWLVAGCASGPEPPPPALEGALLVAPMNLDFPYPDGMKDGRSEVMDALLFYLEGAGTDFALLAENDARQLWLAAVQQVGGLEADDGSVDPQRYRQVQGRFAQSAAESTGVSYVLLPALMLRPARYLGGELRWDGVSRPRTLKTTHAQSSIRIHGSDVGSSVRILVLNASGRKVHEGYGGLEPVVQYEELIGGPGEVRRGDVERLFRDDLFEDPDVIWDGVRAALEGFIAAPGGATDAPGGQ